MRLGASLITTVATATAPFTPRTPKQNQVYHGRLREIAQLEKPGLEGQKLWLHERKLKKWSLKHVGRMCGRKVESSTELSELEFERMNDWLSDVIAAMHAGERRPR